MKEKKKSQPVKAVPDSNKNKNSKTQAHAETSKRETGKATAKPARMLDDDDLA